MNIYFQKYYSNNKIVFIEFVISRYNVALVAARAMLHHAVAVSVLRVQQVHHSGHVAHDVAGEESSYRHGDQPG